MAITRCPYCHAIIDENDKYCNNCGTQLLFADDADVEEEIPGEKILDVPAEEKDYTVDEPEEEKRARPAKDLESEIDEELREGTGEMALDRLVAEEAEEDEEGDVTEEVILVDELEASEAAARQDDPKAAPPDVEMKKAAPDEGEAAEDEDEGEEPEDEDDEEEDGIEDDEEDEEEEDEENADGKDTAAEEELADELEEDKEEAREDPGPGLGRDDETREYTAAAPAKEPAVEKEPAPAAPAEDEPEIEYVVEEPPPDESATAGEGSLRPITFDSKELENLGKTVELSKQKVDKFLEVLVGKTAAAPPASPAEPAPVEPVPETAAAPVMDAEPEAAPAPAPSLTPTGSLPPWASTMKGAPVFEDTSPVETRKIRGGEPATPETGGEVEIFPRRRGADSTIGLPETIAQAPLPFEAPAADEEEEIEEGLEEELAGEAAEDAEPGDLTPREVVLPAGEVRTAREPVLPVRGGEPAEPAEEEAEAAEEAEEAGPRPPFSFSVFFKSKSFDLLFVGLFWLVALWLAAASMSMSLFAILGSMSGSMALLYLVFVALYFFLFKFFLGETLGDRLFRPRE